MTTHWNFLLPLLVAATLSACADSSAPPAAKERYAAPPATSVEDGTPIGQVGAPAAAISVAALDARLLGLGVISIVPSSPTFVSNCIPFGTNTNLGFSGFIYRNVPAFRLRRGGTIAFDLGGQNDVDVRRNIYLAAANRNPAPSPFMFDVISQEIRADKGWTKVVDDEQAPLNPRGDFVSGNYELQYTAEWPFDFPGGGLLVGFGGSPPGRYADFGCDQVLVRTDGGDASGYFYARFFGRSDQSRGRLDSGTGGTGVELGGIVIDPGR